MVTHIAAPSRSNSSLPLSPPLSTTSSARRGPSSSRSAVSTEDDSRRHKRAFTAGPPNSSQSTLIPPPATHPISPPTSVDGTSTVSTQAHHRAPSISSYQSISTTRRSQSSHRHRHGQYRGRSASRSGSQDRVEIEQTSQQNAFPWFGQSGDVEIVIRDRRRRSEKRYLLHHLILAQNSSWFETNLRHQVTFNHNRLPNGAPEMPGASTFSRMEESPNSNSNARQSTENTLRGRYEPDWVSESRKKDSLPALGQSSKWHYELDWSSLEDDDDDMPMLKQMHPTSLVQSDSQERLPRPPAPSSRTKPSAPPTSFFRSIASSISGRRSSGSSDKMPALQPQATISSEETDLFTAYDNLFLCFYNHAPTLSTTNVATAYLESKLLLTLACSYSAQRVTGPRVDHHLLGFGSHLWRQVARYPPSYLKLGYMARSRAIFSEALTHVVGQWPSGETALKKPSPAINGPILLDLVEDKAEELEETKMRIEAKLFRLNLTTSRGERVSPSTSYLDWLAVSLWRQWVADMTTPAIASILKSSGNTERDKRRQGSDKRRGGDGGADRDTNRARNGERDDPRYREAQFYALAGDLSNEAYLTHEEVKKFLKQTRMIGSSSDGKDTTRRFERRLDELKNIAREIVKPLTRSVLQLDISSSATTTATNTTNARSNRNTSVSGLAAAQLGYLVCVKCEEKDFGYVWED